MPGVYMYIYVCVCVCEVVVGGRSVLEYSVGL